MIQFHEIISPEDIVSTNKEFVTVKGVTSNDLEEVIGGNYAELSTGAYVVNIVSATNQELGMGPVVVYRVMGRGDGYTSETSTLRRITDEVHAKELSDEIDELLKERIAMYEAENLDIADNLGSFWL